MLFCFFVNFDINKRNFNKQLNKKALIISNKLENKFCKFFCFYLLYKELLYINLFELLSSILVVIVKIFHQSRHWTFFKVSIKFANLTIWKFLFLFNSCRKVFSHSTSYNRENFLSFSSE